MVNGLKILKNLSFSEEALAAGMEPLSEGPLCLPELDLHGSHLHESVAASVGSAISSLMAPLHHEPQHAPLHAHAPPLHHEPLEKLKHYVRLLPSQITMVFLFHLDIFLIRDCVNTIYTLNVETHIHHAISSIKEMKNSIKFAAHIYVYIASAEQCSTMKAVMITSNRRDQHTHVASCDGPTMVARRRCRQHMYVLTTAIDCLP
ncbi:hypothetical protein EVAR_88667_1 [Eumeta japonica]|uniref:Uncharacterized protein n=1 Tax=Eumeta variegata TaxID=151549 RepID=A0A4C1YA93_EUMVA|nr:hypothetical protein EVAR_88667_1 [Eumeta japonica]